MVGLVAVLGVIFFIYAPFYVYKRLVKNVNQEMKGIDDKIQKTLRLKNSGLEDMKELEGLRDTLGTLKSKKKRNLGLYLAFVILIYLPVILPIVFMMLDFISPYLDGLLLYVVLATPTLIYFLVKGVVKDLDYMNVFYFNSFIFSLGLLGASAGTLHVILVMILYFIVSIDIYIYV